MRHTYKILSAKITNDQSRNEDMIDVEVQIYRDLYEEPEVKASKELQEAGVKPGDPKPFEVRKLGFGLTENNETICGELDRMMETLDIDLENAEKNAVREAALEQANETINSLLEN